MLGQYDIYFVFILIKRLFLFLKADNDFDIWQYDIKTYI